MSIVADEARLTNALTAIKTRLDTAPLDATVQFTPNGHLADGTPCEGDADEQPVMLSADEYPSPLRYEYYNDDHFETADAEKIPKDAYISRFYYTQEQTGIAVDAADLAAQIKAALQSGYTATITAKVSVTEPAVTVQQLKSQTQLVSSFTSSYRKHDGENRVYNVTKLSGIINGQVLEPGVEWSINETAGDRTVANGWKEADGISDGGYTKQPAAASARYPARSLTRRSAPAVLQRPHEHSGQREQL